MVQVTLPETNCLPLEMDGWNTIFLLGFGLFSGAFAVSFREGKTPHTRSHPIFVGKALELRDGDKQRLLGKGVLKVGRGGESSCIIASTV